MLVPTYSNIKKNLLGLSWNDHLIVSLQGIFYSLAKNGLL
jgi:hypothetical protein